MTASWQTVLDYWFGKNGGTELWFGGTPEIDEHIRKTFEKDVTSAASGKLTDWESAPESCLALIILLDQFSLNLYREQPRSYDQSAMAIPIALRAIERGFDKKVPPLQRAFFYMPLMHAEDLPNQERSVELFSKMAAEDAEEALEGFRHFAVLHRDVVARYGRFPGRNEVYGRSSTPEELKYLADEDSPGF
ncbi:MAG: DUF924 family protein [Bdellovibrionota bacterium]